MKDAFENCFVWCTSLKTERTSDLIPGLSSSEFSVMGAILGKWEKTEKLQAQSWRRRPKHFRLAVAHTARAGGKGYVERSVGQKDRRNTYISLDREGLKKGGRGTGQNAGFCCSVMSQS